MDRTIIVVLVLALGYFAFDKFVLTPRREAALVVSAAPNESKSIIDSKSIAVLPFENLSEEKANAFFTDGVQDEILTYLAKIADLKVISRASVMQYKSGAPRKLREIAQQLGVANVVEEAFALGQSRARQRAVARRADRRASVGANLRDRDLADVSPSKAKSPRRSPTSCRRSSRLTRRKRSSSRPPRIWRLSTFTAGRSHFSSRQVSARRANQTCGRQLNFWMKR